MVVYLFHNSLGHQVVFHFVPSLNLHDWLVASLWKPGDAILLRGNQAQVLLVKLKVSRRWPWRVVVWSQADEDGTKEGVLVWVGRPLFHHFACNVVTWVGRPFCEAVIISFPMNCLLWLLGTKCALMIVEALSRGIFCECFVCKSLFLLTSLLLHWFGSWLSVRHPVLLFKQCTTKCYKKKCYSHK